MPKLVDHEERRRLIAQATWRVVSRDGVRAASVRTVAAEAGLSSGALRHYFDDHSSLLLFAARHSLELAAARIREHLAGHPGEPRAVVQACLEELLPLDEQRAAESAVYFGLGDLARLTPDHTALRELIFAAARRLYRLLIAWLAGGARLTPALLFEEPAVAASPMADPVIEMRARSLHMFIDGLAVSGLVCPGAMPVAEVRETLAAELDRVVAELGPARVSGSRSGGRG